MLKNPLSNYLFFLKRFLRLPEIKNDDAMDDYSLSFLHAGIIHKKLLLRKLYEDFYIELAGSLPEERKGELVVELGSGAGFIKEIMPAVITSDILRLPNVDLNFSAINMPFHDSTVSAFLMINTLHHIGNTQIFLKEVNRCLRIGGKLVMIEPANTALSRFGHTHFHYEDFNPLDGWCFEKKKGHLFSANCAIPWIIFCRDKQRFKREYPSLKILKNKVHTPFRYWTSGGFSMRQLVPCWASGLIKLIEILLSPLNRYIGMFMTIELEKMA